MVQYCRKCGQELDDDAEFCDSCGFNLNSNPANNQEENTTDKSKPPVVSNDKKEFVTKLPLILAIIGIIVSIAEGLGTPMLMGWDNIMMAMAIGIIGGLLGIFIMEKLDEPLIGAVEFIVTGALIYMFIARFGEISAVLFIIAAILALYLKGYYAKNKKLWAIPILTVVLIFALLIAGGAIYQANAVNSIKVGNLTQNITNDGYGYYDGYLTGDIKVDSNFDYLCVNVDYFDSEGKVIRSDIGWNDIQPESGKTYKISSWYFEQTQPVKAELKVVDSSDDTTPLYTQNITLSTSSGV
jgi:hypothetical protein